MQLARELDDSTADKGEELYKSIENYQVTTRQPLIKLLKNVNVYCLNEMFCDDRWYLVSKSAPSQCTKCALLSSITFFYNQIKYVYPTNNPYYIFILKNSSLLSTSSFSDHMLEFVMV